MVARMEEIPSEVLTDIRKRAQAYFFPKRRAISLRFPFLAPLAVALHRAATTAKRLPEPTLKRSYEKFPVLLYEHKSPLRRKLGASDPALQEGKIRNLQIALRSLDSVIIPPGGTFSFWKLLGAITTRKGYVDGMLLSRGRVTVGRGGGLCQLSNLLYWLFLHAPAEVLERHHHSFDAFPDNGRTLPFGSGATIMDRILDLRIKNASDDPLQLRVWLSETHLHGALYGMHSLKEKYHVKEAYPFFLRIRSIVFRYNRLVRETTRAGALVCTEPIATNFAPVLYPVPEEQVVTL